MVDVSNSGKQALSQRKERFINQGSEKCIDLMCFLKTTSKGSRCRNSGYKKKGLLTGFCGEQHG
ncbi:MAG: hypothetical protein D3911_13295 [Candidatus Electrothrix sp. AW3_4]|nr:hypothetical protein [Candidatus Electrothrix gigas]